MAIRNAERNHDKHHTDTIPNIPIYRYNILDFLVNNCFFIEVRIDIGSAYYSKLHNILAFVINTCHHAQRSKYSPRFLLLRLDFQNSFHK